MRGLFLQVHKLDSPCVPNHGIGVLKAWHQLDSQADVVSIHAWNFGENTASEHAPLGSLYQVDILVLIDGDKEFVRLILNEVSGDLACQELLIHYLQGVDIGLGLRHRYKVESICVSHSQLHGSGCQSRLVALDQSRKSIIVSNSNKVDHINKVEHAFFLDRQNQVVLHLEHIGDGLTQSHITNLCPLLSPCLLLEFEHHATVAAENESLGISGLVSTDGNSLEPRVEEACGVYLRVVGIQLANLLEPGLHVEADKIQHVLISGQYVLTIVGDL